MLTVGILHEEAYGVSIKKEIETRADRKVLGASAASIVQLLSKDFLKLVLFAVLLAIPLAWYLIQQWLRGFAYHIDVNWWVFILTGILAVSIAFLTVGLQSLKAASVNPAETLQQE